MSFKSVKNLFIILLVAVNIVLACFAYNYHVSSYYTDGETAEKAAKILEKNGLSVNADMLGVRNDTADILYADYDRENYICLAAAILLGKEADGIYMLKDGVRAETLEGEYVYLGYDMAIEFSAAADKGAIENALASHKAAATDKAKAACEFLENTLSLQSGVINEADCAESGEYVFVTVEQSENGLPLYGMKCVFGLRGEKIVYASGKHFFGVPKSAEDAQLLDRINILFSETERGHTGTLVGIDLCYTLYEDADSGKMMYVPSYSLAYSDGNVHTVNAINKKIY